MTPSAPLHVLIIGGGIGGLTLAHGLKRAGIGVAVYERDRTRTDRLQGYRIHINPAGSRALHDCLPPELYDLFASTTGKGSDGFAFYDHRLREVLSLRVPEAAPDAVESHKSVSRITLRQVLLAGLDDVVHFDKAFTRYTKNADGTVTAHFADGTEATGDLLVAADGAKSRVRGQLLPQATLVDTGVSGIAGKVPLNAETCALLPGGFNTGSILAPRGTGMFITRQEFRRAPDGKVAAAGGIGDDDSAAALHPGLLFDNTTDFIMWAYSARREKYGADLRAMDSAALQATAARMIAGWHPHLRELVAASDPSTVTLLEIRSAALEPPQWETGTVTLLGDAIHSMTPMRGIGANTALRDAALLCRNLIAARDGQMSVREAVRAYETEMRQYGFDAVRSSMKALEQATADKPLALGMMKPTFRVLNAVPPLKQRVFARMGND